MTVVRFLLIAVLFCSLHQLGHAGFSQHFNLWLKEKFGPDVQKVLERADLGGQGSFGGRETADQPVKNQPVVMVHGVSTTAGSIMKVHAGKYFSENGYTYAELYGTTYRNGAEGDTLKFLSYDMKCSFVKQVRALIVAVRLYTGRQVDILAFSLGVPVSRKAILGGRCVDTGEDLGRPLTKFIDTFVGVAGPNFGVTPKFRGLSIPLCAIPLLPICNAKTGLYAGICPTTSEFLTDINKQQKYEGQFIYTIYTKLDDKVKPIIAFDDSIVHGTSKNTKSRSQLPMVKI